MSDIVKRLRTEGAIRGLYDVPALQREAADEIERLRGIAEGRAKNAADEIERLRYVLLEIAGRADYMNTTVEQLGQLARLGYVKPEFAPLEQTIKWGPNHD